MEKKLAEKVYGQKAVAIGKERLTIQVKEYAGKAQLGVRFWYEDKESSTWMPGRAGLNIGGDSALAACDWLVKTLTELRPTLEKASKELAATATAKPTAKQADLEAQLAKAMEVIAKLTAAQATESKAPDALDDLTCTLDTLGKSKPAARRARK